MHKKTKLSFAVFMALLAMQAKADVIGTGSTGTGTSNVFGTNSDAVTINGIAADGANIVGNDNTGGVGSTILGNNNNTNNGFFSPGNPTGMGALSGGVAIGNNINTYAGGIGIGNFATAIGGIAICNGCTANTGEVNFGGGMRIIGVADAQLPNDAVNLGQVQSLLTNQNLSPEGSFSVGATYEMPAYFNYIENGTPQGADFLASGVTNGLNVNLGATAGQIHYFDPISGTTYYQSNGFNNVNIGTSAGEYTDATTTASNGNSNVNMGFMSGINTFGSQNTNVGNGSGGEQTGSGNSNYGSNAGGNANVNFTTNIGTDSFSQVDNGTAVGRQAVVTATAPNSAAFGAFSVATEANTVSVGNDTLKRRITNVADPINDGDVVNFKTLKEWTFDGGNKAEIERLDNKINKLQKRSFGGTALAMAMAGAPPNDGHDASFSIGSAIFNDQGAIAASLQLKNVGNGAIVGLGWGVTTARDVGVRATISWQWNPSATKGVNGAESSK